jgi:HAMP domain-containing protein
MGMRYWFWPIVAAAVVLIVAVLVLLLKLGLGNSVQNLGTVARADAEKPVERRSWLYRFFFGP